MDHKKREEYEQKGTSERIGVGLSLTCKTVIRNISAC